MGERRWSPDRAKLAIYEGPELATEEMGMGRGWASVTRSGKEVTRRLLTEARDAVASPPALGELKEQLVARAGDGPLGLSAVLDLAGQLESGLSANERVALANRAIWDLLQEGRLDLRKPS